MSSLKMTFSLASLVLLMALVTMPVMAHKVNATHDALPVHLIRSRVTYSGSDVPDSDEYNYGNPMSNSLLLLMPLMLMQMQSLTTNNGSTRDK